jgi:tRNA threonylcarbamoyladenosine biosynthesis protein TsaB
MRILGFDTATHATVVGLQLDGGEVLRARDDPAPEDHPGHATRLLSMSEALLREAGLRWAELDRIAVGVGPGRFTGLRVGIATARGLAQALSLELVGVSTLRALGQGALREHAGPVLAVVDARRAEVFAACFRDRGGAVEETLAPDAGMRPEGLAELLQRAAGAADAANMADPARWLAVGDGAVRYREQLEAAGVRVPEDDSPRHLIDAAVVCALGEGAPAAGRLEAITPDYRREPDAGSPRPVHASDQVAAQAGAGA